MIRKLILLGFIGLLLGSCDPEVADNKRLNFSGSVTDSIGNPIPNISLYVHGHLYTLGKDFTDSNGSFDFVSLEVSNTPMTLNINPTGSFTHAEGNPDYNPQWGSYSLHIDPIQTERDFYLGNIVLQPAFSFRFIAPEANPNDEISWKLQYKSPYIEKHYGSSEEESTEIHQYESGKIEGGDSESSPIFYGVPNSIVYLSYSINEGAWQDVEIPLTNEENLYEITY